jgi:sugar transferase (PEP-CTERM/EpsH1 system associated)
LLVSLLPAERDVDGTAGRPKTSGRLRLLFVSKRFPFPADGGGKIRTAKLVEHLSRDFDVTLVCNVEHPVDDPYLSQARRLCAEFVPVPWKEPTKYGVRFYADVLRYLASRHPVSVARDYSPPFAARVHALAAEGRFDVLVCDFVQPSINLRRVTGLPILLFQHNVEAVIFARHAETERNPLRRVFWRSQWRKMERFERAACRRFAGVVAVSERDRAVFEGFGAQRAFAIPTAVDADYFRPGTTPTNARELVFTGSMDWLPNEDAIVFFADEILPRIVARVPDVTLAVVGRNPSPRLRRHVEGRPAIRITGRVDDIRPHVERAAVYVVPLRIGGGTRIKLYEAMAMGKPIVSTTVGAEGLPVRDGENVVLADTPDAFAAAVVRLLRDGDGRERLGQAARNFVEAHCSWPAAAAAFGAACLAVASTANGRSIVSSSTRL